MPQQRDPKSHPGAFVGKRLQRARIKAGYSSQDSLAVKIGTERTVIAKAESGERPATPDVLAAWCELCGLDLELYSELCDLARQTNGGIPEWFKEWIAAERVATSLRIWHPLLVPGLFHTEAYARAILSLDGDEADTDALVAARLERQTILDRDEPVDVVAVIDELVLHRMIGSPEIMAEQLTFLSDMSRRPNVVVQVVPVGSGAHAGLGGAFDIATSDGMKDLLRLEAVPADVTTETRSLVRKASVAFDQVRADALPRTQSRDLIRRLGEELWSSEK
jgi:transcriptional regulator with XRE-family HTH domain